MAYLVLGISGKGLLIEKVSWIDSGTFHALLLSFTSLLLGGCIMISPSPSPHPLLQFSQTQGCTQFSSIPFLKINKFNKPCQGPLNPPPPGASKYCSAKCKLSFTQPMWIPHCRQNPFQASAPSNTYLYVKKGSAVLLLHPLRFHLHFFLFSFVIKNLKHHTRWHLLLSANSSRNLQKKCVGCRRVLCLLQVMHPV